jgi:hypothetical protein
MPENSSVFENSLRQLKETVIETFSDEDVYVILFGSRARGDFSHTSDIDVGILPRRPYNRKKLTLLREKIDDLNIPYSVDVVDISNVSDAFREKVMEEGIVWKNWR